MPAVVYPVTLTANTNENVNDLNANLNAITAVVNGNVDSTNLAAGAITMAKVGTWDKAKVRSTINVGFNTGTEAAIAFDAELFDTNAMHDNVTNNTRITIKTAGTYMIGASVQFAGAAGGTHRSMRISRNAASDTVAFDRIPPMGAGNVVPLAATTFITCAVNDYFEVKCVQDSGGSLNVVTDAATDQFTPMFWAMWLAT